MPLAWGSAPPAVPGLAGGDVRCSAPAGAVLSAPGRAQRRGMKGARPRPGPAPGPPPARQSGSARGRRGWSAERLRPGQPSKPAAGALRSPSVGERLPRVGSAESFGGNASVQSRFPLSFPLNP